MKVHHTFATFVGSLTEGITKNVHCLTEALNDQDVDARLDCPIVTLDDLNHRSIHLTKGWDAHRRTMLSLDADDVDLVHFHVSIPASGIFGGLARLKRRDAAKPVLLHVWNAYMRPEDTHGSPPLSAVASQRLFNGAFAARVGKVGFDAAIVSSRYQEHQLRDVGFDATVRVIPNGVDVREFRPATLVERGVARRECGVGDGPVVLYYGHLSPWKGVDHFVDALPRVFEEHPDAQALVSHTTYGNGGDALRSRLEDRGVLDRVTLLGPSHVPTLLAAADVAVVPAIAAVGTACHPNVVLEMLASGIPPVASRVGSIPEAVQDGRTGLLAEPGDHEDIAAQVNRLLSDGALRERMGKAAREDALARFDWDVIAREVRDFYDELVDHPEPAPSLEAPVAGG